MIMRKAKKGKRRVRQMLQTLLKPATTVMEPGLEKKKKRQLKLKDKVKLNKRLLAQQRSLKRMRMKMIKMMEKRDIN